MESKKFRRAGLIGIIIATLAGSPLLFKKFKEICPYLKEDYHSEVSRDPSNGKPKGIFSLTTLEEHLKTIRDGGLYIFDDLFDGNPEYDIIVDKSKNEMAIYLDGLPVRKMKVATGQVKKEHKSKFGEYVTPNGEFIYIRFKNKEMLSRQFGSNASYYGEGMLQLSGPWAPHIAIHGTDNENSIGTYSTNGCIRVSNDNLSWLAQNLGIGSRIHIR